MIDEEIDTCKHGIYPVGSCYTCNGKDKAIKVEEERLAKLQTSQTNWRIIL